jgi:type VI secretion system protein ImpK
MIPNDVAARPRSNSLGLAFQDVITAILRFRYRTQRVADAAAFRESIRKMITAGSKETRRIGYGEPTVQMALCAVLGFLDESVQRSQDPIFRDWASHPLQDELLGDHVADEQFAMNVTDLLNRPESFEAAEALELHATCLLLGYRGRYAAGDDEVQAILLRIRTKIAHVRGPVRLCKVTDAPAVPAAARISDPWVKRLAFLTVLMFLAVVTAFAGYWFLLNSSLNGVQARVERPAGLAPTASALAMFDGGFAR